MPLPLPRPQPIQVAHNPFAAHTVDTRIPKILRDIASSNPDYSPSILRDLEQLAQDLEHGAPIRLINELSPSDYETWTREYQRQAQLFQPLTWANCEWFFAETYLYRYMMDVVRWFETNRDPFAPAKRKEFENARLWQLLEQSQNLEGTFGEKLSSLLLQDLWGNRVDLSHSAAQKLGTQDAEDDDLLVDDRAAVVEHLSAAMKTGETVVHIICDNTGTELTLDLALVDGLLTGGVSQVVMHLKAHPTFVSDALPVDVWHLIDAMAARGGKPLKLAQRLRGAWDEKRLHLIPHYYWNSPDYLWNLPQTLQHVFSDATLVILKGDANYRRAVGDGLWQPDIPFADVLSYFNAPLLALRTMKSDSVAGLGTALTQQLDAVDSEWRVNGKRGVIQFSRAKA